MVVGIVNIIMICILRFVIDASSPLSQVFQTTMDAFYAMTPIPEAEKFFLNTFFFQALTIMSERQKALEQPLTPGEWNEYHVQYKCHQLEIKAVFFFSGG